MDVDVRAVEEAELPATRQARVRAGAAAGELASREWAWRYANNPAGYRAFAAFGGGEVLAHVGLVPRRTWSSGKERAYAEVVDLFEAAPGRGLVAMAAKAALEDDAPGRPVVVHAWPPPAEGRLLGRLLGFETVRTDPWLLGDVGRTNELPAGVAPIERFGEEARWLWDRCAGDFGASTIRDDAFLNWRLRDRPGRAASVLGVRDPGDVLRGYVAWEPGGEAEPETARLVDFLCPPDEPEVGDALLAGARAAARSAGAAVVGTLLVPWSPWFERFQRRGFGVHSRASFLLARSPVRKLDDLWLRDGWWYTLADRLDG